MKKIFVLLTALGISLFTNSANATTIWNYGSTWDYYQASGVEYTWYKYGGGFNTADITSFDWNKIDSTGEGAFSNCGSTDSTVNTCWNANTGLALEKTFDLTGTIDSAVLNYGIDNGVIIFINGVEVERLMEEGYGYQDEHSVNIDSSVFNIGTNKIQILAEDHGGATWADFKLEGNVTPAPEPSSMLLGLIGLGNLLGLKRKRNS